MEKILSQEEINALFSAMSSEDLSLNGQQERGTAGRKIASYDFRRADCISQDQMRSIHLLHEHFGRNFASSLSAYIRAFVDVNLASVEQISYAAFIKALPDPTLVFPMIDMILGGPGCAQSENRNLTEIELNIIEGVVKLAMRDLQDAWHSIMELEFFLEGKGTKAQMFQIVSPSETVIAVHLEIKTAEYSGMMNLCIPSRILKLLRGKFDQQWNVRQQKVPGSDAERILNLLKPAFLPLTGELRSSKLTVSDLLKVSVGDIIELNERLGDPVVLCAGGRAKFVGRMVQRRGKKAFEILERCNG